MADSKPATEKAAPKATEKAAPKKCSVKGCKRPYRAKSYCVTHYQKWRRGGLPKARFRRCKKEGCQGQMVRRGFCEQHASKKPAPEAS